MKLSLVTALEELDPAFELTHVQWAQGFFGRLIGLLGRTSVESSEGLLFANCNAIHTVFMRIPIDVIYLRKISQKYFEVVRVDIHVKPYRIFLPEFGADHVLETKANRCEVLKRGDRLCLS